jgi:hypothetical protein
LLVERQQQALFAVFVHQENVVGPHPGARAGIEEREVRGAT